MARDPLAPIPIPSEQGPAMMPEDEVERLWRNVLDASAKGQCWRVTMPYAWRDPDHRRVIMRLTAVLRRRATRAGLKLRYQGEKDEQGVLFWVASP